MFLQIKNLERAEILQIIFQNVKLFTNNINIIFRPNQVDLQCIDSAHIAIMEIHIASTWFDEYKLSDNIENLVIGVNAAIIGKMFGTRDKIQDITIECDDDPETLSIKFNSDNKNVYNKIFEMPLMDLDIDLLEIPEMEYEAEFSMPSHIYASLMSHLKLFGETMEINCSEDTILLNASSVESGKMSTAISIDDLNEFAIDEGGNLNISYSLLYMCNIANFHKLSKDIELKFKQDYPAKIKYNLGTDDATVVFYIAPKIRENE